MKVPKKIIDHEPNATVSEHDAVTFKKTDASRGVRKGELGTVVDLFKHEELGYPVVTQAGEIHDFKRHEFRIATPEDIARHQTEYAKKQAKAEAKSAGAKPQTEPPEIPEWFK